MEARTAVVAFNREWAGLVLHGEIVTDGARPVTDEVEGLREATA